MTENASSNDWRKQGSAAAPQPSAARAWRTLNTYTAVLVQRFLFQVLVSAQTEPHGVEKTNPQLRKEGLEWGEWISGVTPREKIVDLWGSA